MRGAWSAREAHALEIQEARSAGFHVGMLTSRVRGEKHFAYVLGCWRARAKAAASSSIQNKAAVLAPAEAI